MASSSISESTPLLSSPANLTASSPSKSKPSPPIRPQRNVTFNPHTTISSPTGTTSSSLRPSDLPAGLTNAGAQQNQPMLAALNSKLRRRNSHGTPSPISIANHGPKIGPQRTSKVTQKLKVLPNLDHGEDGPDEESGRDVYSQFTRIKDPTARRDAARLGKADRELLPRVTAYCTANKLQLPGLMRYLKSKGRTRGAAPKLFDECLYSPYNYKQDKNQSLGARISKQTARVGERRFSDSAIEIDDNIAHQRDDLIDLHEDESMDSVGLERNAENNPDFDTTVHTPEVFLFEYGTVVIWGMNVEQETRFLSELAKFESEKLAEDDIVTENFNFYYTREYQARIYNDFISLREKRNYMTKLAISHALAQSVKTSLYEDLVDNTIEATKDLPERIALTGKVNLTRRQINMQIGELFILRINIHLQGSVLDSPELMWAEPQLEPVYQAVRSYLEMDQRVGLLTERLDVIADLLAVLRDQLSHRYEEWLEWIVIILIAVEILVAAINIVVDVTAGIE